MVKLKHVIVCSLLISRFGLLLNFGTSISWLTIFKSLRHFLLHNPGKSMSLAVGLVGAQLQQKKNQQRNKLNSLQ